MNERIRKLYRTLMLVVVVALGLNLTPIIDLTHWQVASLISLNTVLFIRLTSDRRASRVITLPTQRSNGDR